MTQVCAAGGCQRPRLSVFSWYHLCAGHLLTAMEVSSSRPANGCAHYRFNTAKCRLYKIAYITIPAPPIKTSCWFALKMTPRRNLALKQFPRGVDDRIIRLLIENGPNASAELAESQVITDREQKAYRSWRNWCRGRGVVGDFYTFVKQRWLWHLPRCSSPPLLWLHSCFRVPARPGVSKFVDVSE